MFIFQFLRGNTAKNNAYTGKAGEVTVDMQTNSLRVHDGLITGGHKIPNEADVLTVHDTIDLGVIE